MFKWLNRIPGYVKLMIVITASYLSVEIPFSVYLNFFMSGASTTEEMHKVEHFGRLMSGIAVAIAVLGLYLPRFRYEQRSFRYQLWVGSVATAVSIAVTYSGLNMYAEASADAATHSDMRRAYIGMLARTQLARAGAGELRPDNSDPAWRALVSTAAVVTDPGKVISSTGTTLNDLAASEAKDLIGTPAEMRKSFFGENFEEMRRAYDEYSEGSKTRSTKMADIYKDGDKEWAEYMDGLHKQFPDGIPLRGWDTAGVRRKVMDRLPVSSNWNIVDKSGFMVAYVQTAQKEIDKTYRDKLSLAFGSDVYIQPGLSFDGFLATTAIQQRLRDELRRSMGLSVGDGVIYPSMSDNAFMTTVYRPAITDTTKDFLAMASDDASFENYKVAVKGRAAYQAATLPGMAIILSLAGAALHIFKLSAYLLQAYGYMRGNLSSALGTRRFYFGGGVLTTALVASLLWGNSVTSTETFRSISNNGVYASVLEKAIAVQPAFTVLSGVLQTTGIWSVVSRDLPMARPIATAVAATKASKGPVEEADLEGGVPFPIPRPKV